MGTVILANVTQLETIKISELQETVSMVGEGVFPIVQGGSTPKITRNNLFKGFHTDNVIHVAKNGDDNNNGSFNNPFLTINAANNYAIANLPAYPERCEIRVSPGIYTEHLTDSFYRIKIVSIGDPSEKDSSVTIRNTGADEDHYPLGTTTGLNLIGIDVVTTDENNGAVVGIYGKLQRTGTFSYCKFRNGYFIEQDDTGGSIYQYMYRCHLTGSGGHFKLEGSINDDRFINLCCCNVHESTLYFDSTGGSKTIKLDNCNITSDFMVRGDWSYLTMGAEIWSTSQLTFDTNGYIDIFSSVLNGRIHFITDTPETKKVVNCIFKDTPAGQGDITADVAVEFIEYSGNHQCNGINGEIITVSKIKNVGGGQNKYRNIHEALKGSLLTDTIINLEGDIEISEPLTINPGIDLQIDGNKKWKIHSTHATHLVTIGENQQLSFVNMKQITGGKLAVINANGATLTFVSCGRYTEPLYVNLEINMGDVAALVYLLKTTITGTSAPVIKVSDRDPWLIMDRAYIKGASGQPAIEWTVDADSRFRAKYSTMLHGSGGLNSPLLGVGTNDVTISMYNCAMNANFPASDFTNNIGNSNNTIDTQIDW